MTRAAARALWSTVLAVGCAGAAAAVLLAARTERPRPVRAVDPGAPTRLAHASPTPAGTAPSPTAPSPTAPSPTAPSPTAPTPAADRPVRVHLPGIGVTAPVRAVGVDARGDVAIPERVDSVGWYRYSAAPGTSAGSTVLVGHVDSAASGAGAFFRLRDLGRDDRVVLDLAGGRRLSYRVVSRAEFPKTSVPLPDLFSLAGPARLTLITCGGSFDAAVGSYRDNMVITAVPR